MWTVGKLGRQPMDSNLMAVSRALIGEEERLGGGSTGPARGEELFVQVLGHVHYLPAAWRGRAHTKNVAALFQQLFQFRAVSPRVFVFLTDRDKFVMTQMTMVNRTLLTM